MGNHAKTQPSRRQLRPPGAKPGRNPPRDGNVARGAPAHPGVSRPPPRKEAARSKSQGSQRQTGQDVAKYVFLNLAYRPEAYPLLLAYVCLVAASDLYPTIMAEATARQRPSQSSVRLLKILIQRCAFSISDCTFHRPNVYFELGLTLGLHPETAHRAYVFVPTLASFKRQFSDGQFLYPVVHHRRVSEIFKYAGGHFRRFGQGLAPRRLAQLHREVRQEFKAWCRNNSYGSPERHAFTATGFQQLYDLVAGIWKRQTDADQDHSHHRNQ